MEYFINLKQEDMHAIVQSSRLCQREVNGKKRYLQNVDDFKFIACFEKKLVKKKISQF